MDSSFIAHHRHLGPRNPMDVALAGRTRLTPGSELFYRSANSRGSSPRDGDSNPGRSVQASTLDAPGDTRWSSYLAKSGSLPITFQERRFLAIDQRLPTAAIVLLVFYIQCRRRDRHLPCAITSQP